MRPRHNESGRGLSRFFSRWFSQENVDRTISGGIGPQLTLLCLSIVSLLAIFFILALIFRIGMGNGMSIGENFWALYNSFIDPGAIASVEGWGSRLFAVIVSLAGSILLGGVLISTISNIIERRVDAVRSGSVTYKDKRNHYVIIGFSDIAISLIKDMHSKTPGAEIVLMSGVDAPTVRLNIRSRLERDAENAVTVYFGNIESEEELQRLNISKAREVYILGDGNSYGHDSKNIKLVHFVSGLRGSRPDVPPMNVFVQFDGIPSYSNIQKLALKREWYCCNDVPNIYFRPFNYFENWARLLWSVYSVSFAGKYDPLDFRPILASAPSRDHVRLVIVGFTRMGRALLLEALRICHYANYDDSAPSDERIRTVITLVDKDMDGMKDYFRAQFPYLDGQIDDVRIEYVAADVCSPQMRASLEDWSRDPECMLTVAVCVSEPDMSLSLGLNLPSAVYESDSRVLIRQEIQTDLGELIDSDSGKYRNVKIFGMLDQGMQSDMLQDELASFANQIYCCSQCRENLAAAGGEAVKCPLYAREGCRFAQGAPDNASFMSLLYAQVMKCEAAQMRTAAEAVMAAMKGLAHRSWLELSEILRWANRYQIDIYSGYCRALGYSLFPEDTVPEDEEEVTPAEFAKRLSEAELSAMMRMEKHRWNAERTIAGLRYGPKRDGVFGVHPLIIPYSEMIRLRPEESMKDRNVIDGLPYMLRIGGFRICRNLKPDERKSDDR